MNWRVLANDGDIGNVVTAEGVAEEPTVRRITPEEERALKADARREKRRRRRILIEGDAGDVCDPPLSMMAWLTVCTEHGYRCPGCGRYVRQGEFSRSPSEARMAGANVFTGPRCKRCRGLA